MSSAGGEAVTCPRCRQAVALVLAFGFPGERWIKCADCQLLFGLGPGDEPDDRRVPTS